jgi:branched-chain amino acid aminotransferase
MANVGTTPAPDSTVIWMDGELRPFQDATAHVLSHSLHYGSAAFEGIRAYKTSAGKTAIFRAAEHFARLARSVAVFGATLPYSAEQLIAASKAVLAGNKFDECYLRPIAYIGHDSRGLKLPLAPSLSVAIAAWQWGRYLGEGGKDKGIRAHVASVRRPDVASSLPWAKLSGNYLNSIMARREATLRGTDEAILLDQQGYVAEGTGENLFVVRGGVLSTPPVGAILPGITRDAILDLARHEGIEARERQVTRNELYDADEVFFTGTAAEVTPVVEIDGLRIGAGAPGPVTRRLMALFERSVRGDLPRTASWLTYA